MRAQGKRSVGLERSGPLETTECEARKNQACGLGVAAKTNSGAPHVGFTCGRF
jgi:hypothetical protein